MVLMMLISYGCLKQVDTCFFNLPPIALILPILSEILLPTTKLEKSMCAVCFRPVRVSPP